MIRARSPCGAPRADIPLSLVSPPAPPRRWHMPKTQMSRFPIHDDLTAPEESLPVLKGASSAAGQLPNFLGVLAGSPAALRAYARFRAELRHGALPRAQRRADRRSRSPSTTAPSPALQLHTRTSRQAGLGIDEVAARQALGLGRRRARPRCCATCARCWAIAANVPAAPPRGGARGRLERRAAAGSHRGAVAWNPSPRWSTSPATSPSTARWRRRACCARRNALRRMGVTAAAPTSTTHSACSRCCPALPRGRRAGRQALDGRDPLRAAARRSSCASRRSPTRSRTCPTACSPSG